MIFRKGGRSAPRAKLWPPTLTLTYGGGNICSPEAPLVAAHFNPNL